MLRADYVAGFFDGEGSIGIYCSKGGRYYLRTQVTQNVNEDSTKLLSSLMLRWGGNLSTQNTLSGKVKYNWQLNGNNALQFLLWIQPFLLLKKKQCKLATDWEITRPKQFRESNGRNGSLPARTQDIEVAAALKELKR